MMKGFELAEIRKRVHLNQEQFGGIVGSNRVAVSDWEREKFRIPGAVELIARLLSEHPELLPKMEALSGTLRNRCKAKTQPQLHKKAQTK